jgi:hypothetical protein
MCRSIFIGAVVASAIFMPVFAILDYVYFEPRPDSVSELPESPITAAWCGIVAGMFLGSVLGGMSGAATCGFATLFGLRKADH